MVAKAVLRNLRIAPRKVRLVADLIRGKPVEEALSILLFSNKKSARSLEKLLRSAVANADQKPGVNVDKLFVSTLMVDSGPTMKRHRPRAMGRASAILKRSSHVSISLEQAS